MSVMTEQTFSERFVERPMTLDEWADLPADEPGEIVDSVLVEDEVPDWLHEEIVSALNSLLRVWARERGGRVGGSDAKFAVSRTRGRKPDLAVYLSGRRPPARGLIRTAPDIMVEVVSPRPRDGRRDRVEKTLEYAAFGVQYYWIVDPQLRSFEILARGEDGRYVHAVTASQGKVSDVPGCPGLEVDLDDLWKLVDELLVDDEHSGG